MTGPFAQATAASSVSVPTISAFYGIVITMYWQEHVPPHFHARYGGAKASIAIGSGELLRGALPQRALRFVLEWAELHQAELSQNWGLAREALPLKDVEPLP